jgi:hypothetical protein
VVEFKSKFSSASHQTCSIIAIFDLGYHLFRAKNSIIKKCLFHNSISSKFLKILCFSKFISISQIFIIFSIFLSFLLEIAFILASNSFNSKGFVR